MKIDDDARWQVAVEEHVDRVLYSSHILKFEGMAQSIVSRNAPESLGFMLVDIAVTRRLQQRVIDGLGWISLICVSR